MPSILIIFLTWLLNIFFGFIGISVIIGAIINDDIKKKDKDIMCILGLIVLILSYVIYAKILTN